MTQPNFTEKQTQVLELLQRHYPQGVSTDNAEVRLVADSIIARGTGLVELVDNDTVPTGDCYRLTDGAAKAFRDDAAERASQAGNN